jgi:hypothetical protein
MPKTNFFQDLKESECVTLKELYDIKGRGFSPITVKRWINNGNLQQGKHYIKLPGTTGRFKVSLKALNKYLEGIN